MDYYAATSLEIVREMMREPREVPRWLHDRWKRATPIQAAMPWLSWPCIDFLRRRVKPGLRVLEWGGGGSTIFFAAAGCEVTTIETNRVWQQRILTRLAQAGDTIRRRRECLAQLAGHSALLAGHSQGVALGGRGGYVCRGLQSSAAAPQTN